MRKILVVGIAILVPILIILLVTAGYNRKYPVSENQKNDEEVQKTVFSKTIKDSQEEIKKDYTNPELVQEMTETLKTLIDSDEYSIKSSYVFPEPGEFGGSTAVTYSDGASEIVRFESSSKKLLKSAKIVSPNFSLKENQITIGSSKKDVEIILGTSIQGDVLKIHYDPTGWEKYITLIFTNDTLTQIDFYTWID